MDGTLFFGLMICAVLAVRTALWGLSGFSTEEKKALKKELSEELRNKFTWLKKEKKNKE